MHMQTGSGRPIWRLFVFRNPSSNISDAMDRDISSKFGLQIDFDNVKRLPTLHPNPEVDLRYQGCQLKQEALLP